MKKLKIIFLILFIFIFSFAINTNATEKVNLNIDKEQVNLGEETTISVKLDENNTYSLFAYKAKFSYDKDVFEVLEEEDFQEQENWSDITYNPENNEFALINKKGEKSNDLLEIKLKVKEDAKVGKTTITLSNINTSDGKKDIPLESQSVDVTVIKDGLAEGESIPTSRENNVSKEDDMVEVEKETPWLAIIFIIVIIAIIIAVVLYNMNEENEKDKKNNFTAIAIILIIILLIPTIKMFTNKNADTDKNGTVDYEDTKQIIDYLLDIKSPSEEKAKDSDLNNDGKITVTDVAQSVEDVANQNYRVNITSSGQNNQNQEENNTQNTNNNNNSEEAENSTTSGSSESNPSKTPEENITSGGNVTPEENTTPGGNVTPEENTTPGGSVTPGGNTIEGGSTAPGGEEPEDKYVPSFGELSKYNHTPNKEEDITLDLNIEITPYTEVDSVIIDGQKYRVEKVEDNHYRVTVPAPKMSGHQEIVITGVVLDNGKELETEYKVEVDVLKEEPTLGQFVIDTEKQTPEIIVEIVDNDNALTNGKLVVKDENGNVVFESSQLLKGTNKFSLKDLEKDKQYNVAVEIHYDLDSNLYGEPEEHTGSKELTSQNFTVNADYGFEGQNWMITDKVTTEEQVVITFENLYNSYYDVEYVVIKGEKHKVIKEGNTYKVELEKGAKGLNTVEIEKVILKNGTDYEINKELTYVYLKEKPVIGEIDVQFNESTAKVNLDVQDTDRTVKGIKAYLTDDEGNIVDEKDVDINKLEVEFEVNESGSYKLKVEVTYDLGDGNEQTEIVEYKELIKEPIKVTIKDRQINVEGSYVEKGQKVEVTYTIEANTEESITSIVVNGVILPVTKNEDGTYTVNFNAPQEAGKTNIEASRVIFETTGEVEVSDIFEIEVLKSIKPIVDGLSVVEVNEKAILSFIVTDQEDTFVRGKIVITNKETNESTEIKFTSIEDTVKELENIEDFVKYDVDIYVTYDLDSDKTDEINQKEDLFAENQFELIGEYDFSIDNLNVKKVDTERNVIVLEFESSLAEEAADDYYVEKVVINGTSYEIASRDKTIYTVEIPYTDTTRQELAIQEAILNNLQGFEVKDESVVIFKTVPTAIVRSTVLREVTNGLKTITASLEIIDEDNTIKENSLNARLVDPEGKVIDTLTLNGTEKQIVFTTENTYNAGTYTIEVCADYDVVDGAVHEAETIGNGKVSVAIYANIDNAKINKEYVEKGGNVEITYTISSNTNEEVSGIIVNEEILPVIKNEDGTYTVNVKASENYGIHQYNTTRLVYQNEQTSVTNTLTVDVLKDVKPIIEELFVDDENKEKPILSFKVVDEEDTFVSGKIIITDENQNKKEIPFTSKEETTFELQDIVEFKEYDVEIEITYDFDSNKQDTEHQTTEKLAESKLAIIGEYDFNLNNLSLKNIDRERKVVILTFESSNKSKYGISNVIINDKEYSITSREGNTYTVEVEYQDTERQELQIQKAILENLKEFIDINTEKVTVFKKAPIATVNLSVSEDMKTIKATYELADTENVVQILYAKLRDSSGKEIETKILEKNEKEVIFSSKEQFKADTYTVEILADYDIIDGLVHKAEAIATDKVKVGITVSGVSSEVKDYYVKKGETTQITYTIESNDNRNIESLTINGENVVPQKTADGKYVVTVKAPENSGKFEYQLTQIIYSNSETTAVSNNTQIEVLKDKVPTVSALVVDSSKEKPELSFMVLDEEDTFVNGKIIVTNIEENESQEITFETLEKLTFELENIEKFTKYNVEIFITYDFDSDKENKEYQTTEKLSEKQFEIIGDYEFKLSDLKVKEVNRERGVVVLEFTSTNASEDGDADEDYYVDTVIINEIPYENVIKNGTTYTVEVPYTEETRTELVLQKAILDNLQEFDVSVPGVVVFKSVTAIVVSTVAEDAKTITADVKITDEDQIAQNMYVRLMDAENKEIARKSIDKKSTTVEFKVEEGIYQAGDYTVEVVASYDAVDGKTHNNETIVTGTTKVSAKATILNCQIQKYAKKSEKVEVTYTLDTNTESDVKTIVVNNVAYNATKVENNVYKVNVIAPKTPGIEDLIVTRINFQNNESVELQYKSQIEVLKSIAPSVSNLTVDDTQENPILSFNITDEEDTYVNGKIVITDTETNGTREIAINSKDTTSFALENIDKFKKYKVEIYITYDLDSDKTDIENQVTEEVVESLFEIIGDYQFTLDNLVVKEVNRDEEVVVLEFTSTNASEDNDEYGDYYVANVIINGQEYAISSKVGNTYTVKVPYKKEERTELVLEKAILDNLKEFTDLQKSVVIFKNAPTVEVNTQLSKDLKIITANITLEDKDNTLVDLYARLVNPKGEVISTKDIDNDEVSVSFISPEEGVFKAGEYTVEIGADYNLEDGLNHSNKDTIGTGKVVVSTKASITKAEVQNYYVEKGGNVEIKYTVTSNNENAFSGVNIDNAFYSATANDDGTFTVYVPAVTTYYGENKYTASIAVFGSETVILESTVDAEYYVLKNKPIIENFTFNEFVKDQTLTFNLRNDDKALLNNANIVITPKEGGEPLKQQLDEGENKVELNKLENGKYIVGFEGTYDLDDDKANQLNEYDFSGIFEPQEIQVTSTYTAELSITEVIVDKQTKTTKITFSSTNSSNADVEYIVIGGKKYEVVKEGVNTYTVEVPYENEENKKSTITAVVIRNDIQIELTEGQSYEIFKTKPTVTEINTSLDDTTVHVNFKFNDPSNIAVNLKAVIKNSKKEVVEEKAIDIGTTNIDFENATQAGTYTIEFLADFDSVDGEEHKQEIINQEEKTFEVEIKPIITLKEITNIYPKKGEEITLKYDIKSNTEKKITSITIDGIEHEITNDIYEITLNAPEDSGEKIYEITSIKYEETQINVTNRDAKIYVLKDAPILKDYKLNAKERIITFNIDDPNGTIVNGKAIIQTLNGEETQSQDLIVGENKIDLNGEYKYTGTETYKVVFMGVYDLDGTKNDGNNEHQLSDIFKEEEFQLDIESEIISSEFSTRYPKKGEDVEIIYEFKTNTSIEITKIYINDYPYDVKEALDGNKYKVVYRAKDNYGIEELKVNKVMHGENIVEIDEYTKKIDVLKAKPVVKDYEADDNWDEKTITFKFTIEDKDNAIIKNEDGTYRKMEASFGNCVAKDNKNKNLQVGYNEITFENVPENKIMLLNIVVDYDMDSDELNEELNKDDNENNGKALYRIAGVLLPPTVLHVQNITVLKLDESNTPTKFLDKEEEFKISFTADSYLGEIDGQQSIYYPVSAVINGNHYELERSGNIYTTKTSLQGYDKAGEKEITIENITLNNKEVIEDIGEKQTIDVLKDKLTVSDFEVDTSTKKTIASYTLIDNDASFVSGKIIITKIKDGTKKEVELEKDKYEYDLDLEELCIYNVELQITYDLDSNQNNNLNIYTESFGKVENVELINDYKLSIGELEVLNINRDILNSATLQFKSTNVSMYNISAVQIDGINHDVQKVEGTNDTYTFDYAFYKDGLDKRKEIVITGVTLTNNVNLDVKDKVSTVIFKKRPIIQNVQLSKAEDTKIQAKFETADEDSTLKDINVILKNEQGETVNEEKLNPSERQTEFEVIQSGKYKVEINATFDVVDGKTHEDEYIAESNGYVEIQSGAKVKTISISDKYPTKGETIEIKYSIISNTLLTPTKVVLNNSMEYPLTYEEESGTYKISYIAPSETELINLKVTKVYFGDDLVVETPDADFDIIEVLKDKPTINITSTDMLEQKTVVFNITISDPDNAMTSAKAKFHDKEYELKKGSNTLPINVELDEEHTIEVEVAYDLDYNQITNGTEQNDNTGTVTENKNFTLVSDYGFKITNIDTFKSNGKQSSYFEKGETIQLRFNSVNNTSLVPESVVVNDVNDNQSGNIEYSVKRVEDGESENEFYVELKAKASAGKQEFKITSVKLNSSNVITESNFAEESPTAKIEVLKAKPTMSNYTSSNHENALTVNFNIVDDDNALTDSYVKLINTTTNEVVQQRKINKDSNTHTFEDLTPGLKYTVKLENNYSLSEDGNNKGSETFNEEQIEITKKEESDFKIRNLTISKRVPINTKVHISFENSLMSYKDVDTIIIDKKEYGVNKGSDSIYRVDLEPKDIGVNAIHVDSVKIEDKVIDVDRNLSYIYEKTVPTATDVSDIMEDASTGEAIITYKLMDKDQAIKSFTAYMKNSSGSIAATKEIKIEDVQKNENGVSTVSMPLLKMNTYSIELRATCDIGDGKTFEEKSLFEKEKYTEPRVTIISQHIEKEYVDKGESVDLTFKINTNVDQEVKKIYIGDSSYNVVKVTDEKGKIVEDTYTINVPAPKDAGVFEQKVTRVQIGANLINAIYPANTEYISIKVLKDIPTLTHFIIDEKNGYLTFNVNDLDKALVKPYPKFVIKDGEKEVYNGELKNGGNEYKFKLKDVNLSLIKNPYNVTVDVTYDQRPDAPQEMNIFQKVAGIFSSDKPTTIAEEVSGEEKEPEEVNYVITDNIFDESVELTGNIDYKLEFDGGAGNLFTARTYMPFYFDCSTGSEYKVAKVIIDGLEYPVEVYKDFGNGKYTYIGQYKAFSFDQMYTVYEKVILENGAAIDIPEEDGTIYCMVKQTDPTFEITDFIENVKEGKVRFNFKLVDDDEKLATDITFTLMDSQGKIIEEKKIKREDNQNSIEFDIPNPPTSVYKLKVTAQRYEIPGYDGYLIPWTGHDGEYQSSINTSILRSTISNKYPKKGETITIDYGISSTKVVLIDKEDHSNQDKAVNITALTINGKDYDVQALEEKEQYRIYYTAGEEDGIENLQVTHIKFSNGDIEEFVKNDEIEVLKDAPQIENFKTENKVEEGKIKFSFDVIDVDNVLATNSIYAKLGNETKELTIGHNDIEFSTKLDELATFEIKATYDLDTNTLPNEAETNDNLYTDYTIFEKQVILTGDYRVEFSNIETFNSKGENTKYFEKNEDIKVTFDCSTVIKELYPETITIDGNTYTLEKVSEAENKYTLTIPGKDVAGEISVKIDTITLNSGNEVAIQNQAVSYEILKDIVEVKDFTYYIPENADKINLTIFVEDRDNANKELTLEIQDEYGEKVTPSSKTLNIGENNITFTRTTGEKYFVSINSTYDRDINDKDNVNYYNNEKIHYQIVSITTRYIEMKDIVDIKLYRFDEYGNAVKVDSLSESNLKVLDNCLVEVTMKNIPTFYSKVTKYSVVNGKLKLVLAYTDAMVYTGDEELKPLEVTLDILDNTKDYEYSGSFKSLVEKMRAKPDGEFTLDKDYDLSDYPLGTNQKAIIDFDFKGKLNGNGHTISNLTKPFFQKLDGANLENIVFKGIVFEGGDGKGAIAIYATNYTKISNVHVENVVSPGGNTGGLVYELSNYSVIEKSSATNLTFNISYTTQNVAGAIVSMKNYSKIENCYVQGVNSSGWWRNSGFVVLSDKTSEISHNIVNMRVAGSFALTDKNYGYGNAGIVSHTQNSDKTNEVLLKNNLSLVEGNSAVAAIYNYKGSSLTKDSVKNYQLDTAVVKNEEGNGVITISKDKLNADFFRNELGLDEKIWTIKDDASINNLPVLKGVSVSFNDGGKQPKNTEVYIPDYNRVSQLASYREDREITYHNMYKLMPFYDAKEIIRDGNKIPNSNELNTKIIKYVVPFNKEGKMISSLTTDNYNSLDKIHIVFEDGTKLTYHIDFDDYYGNVASYMITDLNIGYNYNKYIVDPQQDIIQELIREASKYEFRRDLDPVTVKVEEDSRLYKEHYDQYTKNHIEEFIINTLVNMGYSPNFESDVLDTMIRQELIDTGKLKQLLFAYNYFSYWYNLDMDGINLADSVMFNSSEMFDKEMTFSYLAEQLVQGTNSVTNGTAGFYNNYFVKYTKIANLGLYLDYYVTTLTHYTDGNTWFEENWKGGRYYYVNAEGAEGLDYTLWDHLKKDGKVQNDFLPLCTVPENSTYAIASPSQAYFGSLRVYMTDPNDENQIKAFEEKVQKWLGEVKYFYKFAYDFWGKDTINKYCDVNYDMRTTYTGKGNATVYNNPLTTEEPYHKYFIEAVGRWAGTSGGAYANGNEVFWVVIKMLDNFRVGTHETLHNQDSKIFLNGYGRRGGAEDYAAGFIQQYYRDGWVSPNIFDEEPNYKDNTTQNLRRSSVETDKKLQAFYDKYFRVNDFLDWIEAQAYFQLTAEQKANISVQVSYPETTDQEAGDDVVAYNPLTKDAVEKMNLNNMEDLWNNKIMLRPGVKEYERRSPGADTDSIFNIHWYQPHADNDRPDGANFKYLAWQMAGEKGYYEGLCAYYSQTYVGLHDGTGRKTTDLIALRYIMEDENITYKQYKLDRYKKLSQYYNLQGTYVDAQEIYQEYLTALQTDANNKDRSLSRSTAVKKKYFQQIRKETNDFNIEPFEKKTKTIQNEEIKEDSTKKVIQIPQENKQQEKSLPKEQNTTGGKDGDDDESSSNTSKENSTQKDITEKDANSTNTVNETSNVVDSNNTNIDMNSNTDTNITTKTNNVENSNITSSNIVDTNSTNTIDAN